MHLWSEHCKKHLSKFWSNNIANNHCLKKYCKWYISRNIYLNENYIMYFNLYMSLSAFVNIIKSIFHVTVLRLYKTILWALTKIIMSFEMFFWGSQVVCVLQGWGGYSCIFPQELFFIITIEIIKIFYMCFTYVYKYFNILFIKMVILPSEVHLSWCNTMLCYKMLYNCFCPCW